MARLQNVMTEGCLSLAPAIQELVTGFQTLSSIANLSRPIAGDYPSRRHRRKLTA